MPFTKDAWGSSQYERNLQMGFNIGGPSLIDIRLVLTKEQMKTVDRHVMPPKYFALCADNNQLYYYDKSLNRGPIEKEDGRIIGNFTRVNIQISGIQDQYGNSLIDGDVAKIFVARKLSELINDRDSEGYRFITEKNAWQTVKDFSNSEQGIFSTVATTGDYNDLLNLPFIPDDAVYVNYFDPNGVFDELNGGTGNQDITVKQALDAISAAFTDEDVLPIIIETGDSESTHKIRHKAEKLEIEDKPFIAFKLNVSDFYNDAHYTSKEYVDSENLKQDLEIEKRQHTLVLGDQSPMPKGAQVLDTGIDLIDSEDTTIVNTHFKNVTYTGSYSDVENKPVWHTDRKMVDGTDIWIEAGAGFYNSDGSYVNDLSDWLSYADIENYSSEYVRLRNVVEGSDGVLERLDIIENSELPSKQDKLIPSDNIQIASDGVTIRAVDTKYEAGYNVVIDATSDGELFIINTKDSRYLEGDNIVITSEGEDSEGKLYRISAKDTLYNPGWGIELNSENGKNVFNVLVDGLTIKIKDKNDGNYLYASAIGQYGARSPIDLVVETTSESSEFDQMGFIYLQYDSETLKYDSEKGLYVSFKDIIDQSLSYSEGALKVALSDDPIYYSTHVSYSEGYHIEVRFDKDTISYSPSKGLYLNLDPSIYVDSEGKLTATGKVKIAGDGIKVVGSEGVYTIGFDLADNTLIITPDNKLKGNYQAGTGLTLNGNVINHSNHISAGGVGGYMEMPVIGYDSEGHIREVTGLEVYPPTEKGEKGQFFMSMGSEGANTWMTLDDIADSESVNGISSKGVYNSLAGKQDKLILDDYTLRFNSQNQLYACTQLPEFIRVKLLADNWTKNTTVTGVEYYTQEISEGIDKFDVPVNISKYLNEYRFPIITLDEVRNPVEAAVLYSNWNGIYDTTVTADGFYKFYCVDVPNIDLPLKSIVFNTRNTSEG